VELKIFWAIIFWKNLNFQNIINTSWKEFDWFHDFTIIFIIFILLRVGGILLVIIKSNWIFKEFVENSVLEILWTFFPIIILLNIGVFRIIILYNHEIEKKTFLSVKVTGHQWYWSYDYTDFKNLEFDRYILPLGELGLGSIRLLDVDNNIVIPIRSDNRFIISRADVLHSWTIPVLGVKVDANPGRLNIISFFSNYLGLFYGQCSEICGANHRFMPICLETTSVRFFKNWVITY
jgi:cytochrome c oxidase subunit 2